MVHFLAKVIVALESNVNRDLFHQTLREVTAHNKSNLLEMIGVEPVIFRTETSIGSFDLQIWIVNITGSTVNQMVVPFYFAGARKYLFMCSSENAASFVRNTIDLVSETLNALNEVIVITPKKGAEISKTKLKRSLAPMLEEKGILNYTFKHWSSSEDLGHIFEAIVDDLVTTPQQDLGYVPVDFDLRIVEEIAKRQGFTVNENHEIVIPKDKYIFIINLKKNEVYAEMSNCSNCKLECKSRKKLCILISNKGFANIAGLGDLRMLSILFAIEDGSIFKLKGKKPHEDMSNQLKELRQQFKKKCTKE